MLHVRDIAHPDSGAQKEDVLDVLAGLIDAEDLSTHVLEVWNKVDLMTQAPEGDAGIGVSALTGQGVPELLAAIDGRLTELFMTTLELKVPAEDGERLAWLYRHGSVLLQDEQDGVMHMTVRLTHENAARWNKH